MMMDYMDIPELEIVSILCKNMKNDTDKYAQNKKYNNLKELIDKHSCRCCNYKNYNVENQFCIECLLHMCHNCYSVRQNMFEFVKLTIPDSFEYKMVCHDYCMFRCHQCKLVDSRHELFLNDKSSLQSICVDCFIQLNENDKLKYEPVHQNDDNVNDWDLNAFD
jgi:hypothetical protein